MVKFKLIGAAVVGASVLALEGVFSSPASALSFKFSYSGTGVTASGTLTTTDLNTSTNAYTITGITGTRNGITIENLLGPGTFLSNNNLLFNNLSALIDFSGFSYRAGGSNYNVFGPGCGYPYGEASVVGCSPTRATQVSFSATPTTAIPTPALLPGLIGLGAAAFRKRKGDRAEAVAAQE